MTDCDVSGRQHLNQEGATREMKLNLPMSARELTPTSVFAWVVLSSRNAN